jgi:ABC-2 type transport system ATP-binding protein
MTAASPLAFELEQADLEYAPGVGVFDLTLRIPQGAIVGLIGPSGCGKSSMMRLLLGLHAPTAGTVRTLGKAPTTFNARDRESIGYIPQQFALYPNLSVSENAHFVSSLYGMPATRRKQRLHELLEFVELTEAKDRLARQLSGGMQRRLMLLGALMHNPQLLFADEPTAGIDPVLRDRFWDSFRTLRDEGRTLLVSTQYVGEAAYCDYVAVMRKGRILTVDTPEGLRRSAMGGEIVRVKLDTEHVGQALKALRAQSYVHHVGLDEEDDPDTDILKITVEEAGLQLPLILNLLEAGGATILHAEESVATYDEVFIAVMQGLEVKDGRIVAAGQAGEVRA